MDEDCLFFPELYRIVDWEKDNGRPVSDRELKKLVERCTLCGLCPCPNVRNDVIKAKAALVRENGVQIGKRLLADVQKFGRTCGMAPKLINRVLYNDTVKKSAKNMIGIHPDRQLPDIPAKSFFLWAKERGLTNRPTNGRGVAYFAGCSTGYLFPEVGRAAVEVLERNGVTVFVPPQQCCGMPTLVEGDLRTTLRRSRSNMDTIFKVKKWGFEPVSGCPTCGFLMKVLLKEGAYYSKSFQQAGGSGHDEIKVPDDQRTGQFALLKKSVYGNILQDDGLFKSLNPLKRIALAESFWDIGEYLARLLDEKKLSDHFEHRNQRIVYFAPCHQREQKIGSPYLRLLSLIPGISIEQAGGSMDCCGMGGSLGYKKDFHGASLSLGEPVASKISAYEPDMVATDCLSCRLQFKHLLPFSVYHPLEIMSDAYNQNKNR